MLCECGVSASRVWVLQRDVILLSTRSDVRIWWTQNNDGGRSSEKKVGVMHLGKLFVAPRSTCGSLQVFLLKRVSLL